MVIIFLACRLVCRRVIAFVAIENVLTSIEIDNIAACQDSPNEFFIVPYIMFSPRSEESISTIPTLSARNCIHCSSGVGWLVGTELGDGDFVDGTVGFDVGADGLFLFVGPTAAVLVVAVVLVVVSVAAALVSVQPNPLKPVNPRGATPQSPFIIIGTALAIKSCFSFWCHCLSSSYP